MKYYEKIVKDFAFFTSCKILNIIKYSNSSNLARYIKSNMHRKKLQIILKKFIIKKFYQATFKKKENEKSILGIKLEEMYPFHA